MFFFKKKPPHGNKHILYLGKKLLLLERCVFFYLSLSLSLSLSLFFSKKKATMDSFFTCNNCRKKKSENGNVEIRLGIDDGGPSNRVINICWDCVNYFKRFSEMDETHPEVAARYTCQRCKQLQSEYKSVEISYGNDNILQICCYCVDDIKRSATANRVVTAETSGKKKAVDVKSNSFVLCGICHQTEPSEGMIEISTGKIWVGNTKICRLCVKNIVITSKGVGKNEFKSFDEWMEQTVTADEYNRMVQTWFNTHENGQDELILMMMQWISSNRKSSILRFLWDNSEKPECN